LKNVFTISHCFSQKFSLVDKFKDENLENEAIINQVETEYFTDSSMYHSKEKLDEVLEAETRGVDLKGNVSYFCPKCNVRYIEFKYLKTHLKECGNIHKCQMCQQKFKQKRTFTAHMKKKHKISAPPEKHSSLTSDKAYSFLLQSS